MTCYNVNNTSSCEYKNFPKFAEWQLSVFLMTKHVGGHLCISKIEKLDSHSPNHVYLPSKDKELIMYKCLAVVILN